jgi:membrane protease subunit HflC
MRALLSTLVVLIGLAAAAVWGSLFIVDQNRQAIVLRFGEVQKVITKPGLNYKLPAIDIVHTFDKRVLDLDTNAQEVIASDKKRLVVDSFARYRIIDPLKFFQTLTDERIARSRLGLILDASLRRVLGSAAFSDVVKDKREQLMSEIQRQLNAEVKDFGVELVDVRIKRADLPEANSKAVFQRMQTERQREAADFRAQGQEQALRIKAEADRQVTVTVANATRDADKIRGDGEAERNKTFAEAFGKDADFFAFYRSMQAYEQGLKSGDTRLILSPDSEFFRYFGNSTGQPSGATPSQTQR